MRCSTCFCDLTSKHRLLIPEMGMPNSYGYFCLAEGMSLCHGTTLIHDSVNFARAKKISQLVAQRAPKHSGLFHSLIFFSFCLVKQFPYQVFNASQIGHSTPASFLRIDKWFHVPGHQRDIQKVEMKHRIDLNLGLTLKYWR